jgi:hypothetical protein
MRLWQGNPDQKKARQCRAFSFTYRLPDSYLVLQVLMPSSA